MNYGNLALAEAEEIVAAALAEAAKLGKAFSVAVVDAEVCMLVVKRSDGARPLTPSIAVSEARSHAAPLTHAAEVGRGEHWLLSPSCPACPTTRSSPPRVA